MSMLVCSALKEEASPFHKIAADIFEKSLEVGLTAGWWRDGT
jgi:hypothetical protein